MIKKTCIWCRFTEPEVTFKIDNAHIFPKSLGGTVFCQEVCTSCNHYFGSKQAGLPSVEIALKELLNISRLFLLRESDKGVSLPRFKGEYFDFNLEKGTLKPKLKFSLLHDFQITFMKQFRRGIFKIFLEERSRSKGDALSTQFDFIREFARYGLGDYPVYHCQTSIPAVFITSDLKNPVIRFTENSEAEMKQFGFYSYDFFSSNLAIPVIRSHELTFDNYKAYLFQSTDGVYNQLIDLKKVDDFDFTFASKLSN